MNYLPPEILLKIALDGWGAWNSMLVVRAFAEMSFDERIARTAMVTFGYVAKWKKNYDVCIKNKKSHTSPEKIPITKEILRALYAMCSLDTIPNTDGPFVASKMLTELGANALNLIYQTHRKLEKLAEIYYLYTTLRPYSKRAKALGIKTIMIRWRHCFSFGVEIVFKNESRVKMYMSAIENNVVQYVYDGANAYWEIASQIKV